MGIGRFVAVGWSLRAIAQGDRLQAVAPSRFAAVANPPGSGSALPYWGELSEDLARSVLDLVPFRHRVASWVVGGPAVTLLGPAGPRGAFHTHADGLLAGVLGASFSPLGDILVTWSRGGAVVVSEVASGEVRCKFKHAALIECVWISPSGDWALLCDARGACVRWAWTTCQRLASVTPRLPAQARDGFRMGAEIFPSGDRFLLWGFVSTEDSVPPAGFGPVVVDVSRGRLCEGNGPGTSRIRFAQVFPAGDRILAGGWGGEVTIWSTTACQPLRRILHGGELVEAIVLHAGRVIVTVATSTDDYTALLWRTASGEFIGSLVDVYRVARFPDSGSARFVAVGLGFAEVWDAARLAPVALIERAGLERVLALPGGDGLVGLCGQSIAVWDLPSGKRAASVNASGVVGDALLWDVAIGLGTTLDPQGFGRGLSWRRLPQ